MTDFIRSSGCAELIAREPVISGPVIESMLRDVIEGEAGRATLSVASESMNPRLEQGDRVVIERASPRSLMPGDVLVFRSESAGLVVHRLIWRDHPLGRPSRIFTKGDALDYLDRSVQVDRVLGRVVSVTRGEDSFSPTTLADRWRCVALAAGYGVRRLLRGRIGVASPTLAQPRSSQAGGRESR